MIVIRPPNFSPYKQNLHTLNSSSNIVASLIFHTTGRRYLCGIHPPCNLKNRQVIDMYRGKQKWPADSSNEVCGRTCENPKLVLTLCSATLFPTQHNSRSCMLCWELSRSASVSPRVEVHSQRTSDIHIYEALWYLL